MTKREMIAAQIAKEAAEFCVPGWATPTWRHHYAKGAFTKGQRVAVKAMGRDGKWNWDEHLTVVNGKPMSVSPRSGDWYLVKFDDAGTLHVHETQLSAVDQRLAVA